MIITFYPSAINESVIILHEMGVDIRFNEDWGLQCAAEKGQFEVVRYLVENGADVHACDGYPLHSAKLGAQGSGEKKSGVFETPRHSEVVAYLIEHGAVERTE